MKKRRTLSILCFLALLVSLLGSTQASAATYDNYYITTVDGVRIRSSNNTNSDIVAEVSARTRLQDYNNAIVANTWRYNPYNWARVYRLSNLGYVRCDLVCPLTRAYQVNVSSILYLRTAAYATAPIEGSLVNGTVVAREDNTTTVSNGITWVRVVVMTGNYESHSGYVALSYLSLYGF